ncbi:hypothetical protein Vretimale_19347 [Volvox reticuliferus]|nr:hypothetical protein Vretifemale_19941 [Volvox reticuliferus]GIM16752.1 hypothetical protein Vretimale_19347 [Volvox reticuliferus]
MQPEATSADAGGSGPATKRPRVEDVLQQHAPREQLLVSELMGWRGSSQEPLSTMGTVAASIGLTDFRALYARQPSQQHLAQQRAPNVATTGLRTFIDVASRPAMGPEDVGRQEVLGALRAAYNTAGSSTCSQLGRSAAQHVGPRQQDAAGIDPSTGLCKPGATAAAGANALEGLTLEQLPVDWGIKRSLTFTSSARFGIYDRAQQAPPRTRWRALQSNVNSDLDTIGDEVLQYLSSQLSWRHPEVSMDASALAAARSASLGGSIGAGVGTALASATPGGTCSGSGGWLAQRLAAWRSALHSLYGTYRGGDCNVFYVINSAPRNPFVALFAYKGVRGSSELCAVVSQSTRVLRGRMLAAGLPFTMPLERIASGADAAAGNRAAAGANGYLAGLTGAGPDADPHDDADAVLCDEGPQASPSSSAVADNSRGSLLLLRGPRGVHGLYDFLMNDTSFPGLGGRATGGGTGPGDELNDLPLLLAPVPFDGGAVWRPTIKALTLNGKLAGDSIAKFGVATTLRQAGTSSESDPGTVLHVLQLSGLLPPWTVRRFCSLMARLQPSGYSAMLETEPCSITLNSRVIEERPGGDGGVSGAAGQVLQPTFAQGGALTLEELVAWQQPVALPGGRPVKVVTCNDVRRLSVRV